MKVQFAWVGVIASLFMGISTLFIACNKDDMNSVVNYRGQVVYINTTMPFADLTVKVTDGKNTHCQTQTDAGGTFSLKVRVDEIDGNYYLLAGDSTCIPKKVALGSYGQAEVDLGIIEVEGPALPTVVTRHIESVSADEAILGGEVQTDGRLPVTARGVCYGTEQHPTIDGLNTKDGSGLGEFTSTLKNLKHNTIYYARAYATNKMGTAYGEQVKFTTELGVPIVITDSVYRITVHSARCKGHVDSDGGYPVTQRGTCWSRYPDPTKDDDFTNDGSGTGDFTSALNNLQENTTYYVRTYATNSTATVYGEQKIITTLDGLATVHMTNTTTTATSMVVNCEVTDDAGYSVTERGICYSTINSEPSIEDEKKANGRGKGTYSVSVSELVASKTYYVRAYAINEYGVAYSDTHIVITKNGVATVGVGSATNITDKSASCSVKVTDTGGSILQSCGICWSTTQNPTIENNIAVGGNVSNAEYNCNLTNLLPSTTYYVRAYATTDITTSYSPQKSFTTISGLPSVSTAVTTATSTTITSGGQITSDGGYNITGCGICYSTTNSNPTIADNHIEAGVVTNSYSVVITRVSVSTTYYVRAYATNSIGTSYGSVVMVTTDNGLPTVSTTEVTKSGSSLVTGGNITSDGGFPITDRGVCYGNFPNPDLSDTYNHTSDGTGIGYYTSSLGSSLSGIIYVRAYATNINGTTYGEQISVDASYLILPTFTYGSYTYKVAPTSSTIMYLSEAINYCNAMEYCGYTDWFLPSKEMLSYMYTQKQQIGGFYNSIYWSSTKNCTNAACSQYYSNAIDFSNGANIYKLSGYDGRNYVRPIRLVR